MSAGEIAKRVLDEIEAIRDQLVTGGYDATEGEDGSNDTTWTDFGIVVGYAERYFRAYLEAEKALRESANALTNLIAWCDGPLVAHEDARRIGTAALQAARAFLAEQEAK